MLEGTPVCGKREKKGYEKMAYGEDIREQYLQSENR